MNTKPTQILLIEDNPGDVLLVRHHLKDASFKYDLLTAETLYEGVEIIKNHAVDIALLDLSLPDCVGFKTLVRYIELVPQSPVIVLTGMNNEIVGNQAVKAGAQDFLVKGQFDGKFLGRSIRYSIQRFLSLRKMEETQREMTIVQKRAQKAHQLAGFGNWEMDLVSGEMNWTDEVCRILGVHPGGCSPGLPQFLKFIHPDDRSGAEKFFEDAVKDGRLYEIEFRIIVGAASVRYLSAHAQIFIDDSSRRMSLIGGLQDVTARKLNEQAALERNVGRQTATLKKEILTDMGFHIRTPLTSIINLLYLFENGPIPPYQTELMEGLKTSVADLSATVTQLLTFSLLGAQNLKPEPEICDSADFFNSLKKLVQFKADKSKVLLEFQTDETLSPSVLFDAKKITQIVYTLFEHALAQINGARKISIHAREESARQKSYLYLLLTYSGKNMTVAQLEELLSAEKILETPASGDLEAYQRQVALAVVGKLTTVLEGTCRVYFKNGETCFEIKTPLQIVRPPATDVPAPEASVKILLVEDHFLHQMGARKILTSWSPLVTVDIAENGIVAVEKFLAHTYDLILMDIQMPVMNGWEATKRIRERSAIPIIGLTASASIQEAEQAKKLGMNDYMAKPFKPRELYQKITDALAGIVKIT